MNKLLIIAVMVTLLALSAESFRMPRQAEEEEAGILTKITDTIKSYYDNIQGENLEMKVRNLCEVTIMGVGMYFVAMQQELYHILYLQQ